MHRLLSFAMLCCCLTLLPRPLQAQPLVPGRFEVAAGGRWIGRTSTGGPDATLTAADGTRFRLFKVDGSFGPAAGVEGRVGVRVIGLLQLEGSASYARPSLRVRISSDVEGVPNVELAEKVKQWTIDGALVAHLPGGSTGTRAVPFVSVGGGYVRQLHEGETLVSTGAVYHVGGGVDFPLRRRDAGGVKSAGWRADARAAFGKAGAALDDSARVSFDLGASVFLRF